MSALGQEWPFRLGQPNVRFAPEADIAVGRLERSTVPRSRGTDHVFGSRFMTVNVIASTPAFMVGSGTGANWGE